MEPWIIRQCRLTCRRQVVAWAVILLAGLGFVAYNTRYVNNFFRGPFQLSASDLAQVDDADKAPRYFVAVAVGKVAETGVQEFETETENGVEKKSAYPSATFYAVQVGAQLLIVKSRSRPAGNVSGELKPFYYDLSNQLFTGVDSNLDSTQCYPFYLDTQGFRTNGYWGIAIAALMIVLVVAFARPALSRLRDIETHPAVKRARLWGDPIGISVEAEREFNGQVRYKAAGLVLTDNYAFQKSFFTFNLYRFHDLLWAYKKVTQRRVNFIPAGKSYSALLHFYGGNINFMAKEKRVEEVLQFSTGRAPWAVLGYSADLNKLFTKQVANFCAAVEARRRDLAGKPA
jgi:hypothetical protein